MSQIIKPNTGGGPSGPDLHVARFIVSAGGTSDGANYTTIASAYAAAVAAGSPQTVFIQPGTYTENITLSAGINIAAFECDAMTPNVTILGTLTATYSGNCSISGINFETNSDNILVMSGSNATELSILNCYFTISNATAFNLTNSNSNSLLNLAFCHGDISSTGITLYSSSFAGSIQKDWCKFTNSGNSTTASTFSSGAFQTRSGYYNNVFEFTGSSSCDFNNSVVFTSTTSATPIIVNSTSPAGGNNFFYTRFDSGSGVGMTIGAGALAKLVNCSVYSTNGSAAISGLGTINYTPIYFLGTQDTVTVSTQTALPIGPDILPVKSGTAGQVWTSNGAGVPPTFANPTGSPTYFQAYRTTNQTVAAGNTSTTIIFDTVIDNVGSAYNTGTGVFTAPATGYYSFSCTCLFDNLSSVVGVSEIILAYTGNAQSLRLADFGIGSAKTANSIIFSNSWSMPMNSGDTIQMQPFVDGSGNYIIDGNSASSTPFNTASTFSGFRVA